MGNGTNSHQNLLEELLIEIFFRCSVKSLLCAKCVCKKWHFLLKEPKFILNHIQYQKNHNKGRLFFQYSRTVVDHTDFALYDDETLVKDTYHDLIQLPYYTLDIEGPANGLYCLFDSGYRRFVLWNPALKEFRIIPLPHPHFFPKIKTMEDHIGFGIDRTNNYKLVLIRFGNKNEMRMDIRKYVTVYNPTTNTWKLLYDLGSSPLLYKRIYRRPNNLFINGINYWGTFSIKSEYDQEGELVITEVLIVVIAFDLEDETFREILGPSNLDYKDGFPNDSLILYNDDKIALVHVKYYSTDLWVMHEEGVWINQFSFSSLPEYFTSLGAWKDDGFLFYSFADVTDNPQMILCSAGNPEMRYLGPKARCGHLYASIYYESMVLVDNGMKRTTSLKTVAEFLSSWKEPYYNMFREEPYYNMYRSGTNWYAAS